MDKDNISKFSRRDLIKMTGLAALSTGVVGSLATPLSANSQSREKPRKASGGPYNILMIVTDQERHMASHELPNGYRLPLSGYETPAIMIVSDLA